jgi:hypothetical protein
MMINKLIIGFCVFIYSQKLIPIIGAYNPEVRLQQKVRIFLGSAASVLIEADEITAYKLGIYKDNQPNFEGFSILSKPIKLQPKQSLNIKKLFATDAVYSFDKFRKNCTFTPTLGLEFKKGNRTLRLLICYDCNVLRYVHDGLTKEEDFDLCKKQVEMVYLSIFKYNR